MSEVRYDDCPRCKATGNCRRCDGKGSVRGESCSECDGTGECQHCGGEGQVRQH